MGRPRLPVHRTAAAVGTDVATAADLQLTGPRNLQLTELRNYVTGTIGEVNARAASRRDRLPDQGRDQGRDRACRARRSRRSGRAGSRGAAATAVSHGYADPPR